MEFLAQKVVAKGADEVVWPEGRRNPDCPIALAAPEETVCLCSPNPINFHPRPRDQRHG